MFLVDRTAFGLHYALGHLAFDVLSGPCGSAFTSVQLLENAEIIQDRPMSGPSFRRLTAFRISF